MFVATDKPTPAQSGLAAIVLLLRFHGIGADPAVVALDRVSASPPTVFSTDFVLRGVL